MISQAHIEAVQRALGYIPADLARAAQAAVSITKTSVGIGLATPEEIHRREAICEACPNMVAGRCKLCGCKLKFKRRDQAQACPEGRW